MRVSNSALSSSIMMGLSPPMSGMSRVMMVRAIMDRSLKLPNWRTSTATSMDIHATRRRAVANSSSSAER